MDRIHRLAALTATLALITVLPTSAAAQGLYGSVSGGYGAQATVSTPYGENIAADPDFPGAFGGGDGPVGAVSLGYSLSETLRIEGRVGLHRSRFEETEFGTGARDGEEYILDGRMRSVTGTVEVAYGVPLGPVAPYVKAGAGVASNGYSARLGGQGVAAFDPFDGTEDGYYDAYSDERTTSFAWTVGAGASAALSPRLSAFAEYQYVALGDGETGQDDFTDGFRVEDAAVHEGLVGLRVRFGSER